MRLANGGDWNTTDAMHNGELQGRSLKLHGGERGEEEGSRLFDPVLSLVV